MSDINNVNERIKALRKTLGVSQKYMASALGVTQSHLSEVESGNNNPSELMLRAIMYKWDVRYDWLFHGEGEMFLPKVAEGQAVYGTGISSSEQKEVWEQIEHIFENGTEDDVNALMGAVERIFIKTKRATGGQGDEGADSRSGRFPGGETEPPGKAEQPA